MGNYKKNIKFNPICNSFAKKNYRESDYGNQIDISKYKKTRMHVKKRIPLKL